MNPEIIIERITAFMESGLEWLQESVINLAVFQQCALVFVAILVAWRVSKKLARWLNNHASTWASRNAQFLSTRLHMSLRELLAIAITPILLWATTIITTAAGAPVSIIAGAATLATAWALIRYSSSILKSRVWSKNLAIFLWSIAALSILGLLNPTLDILDNAVIPIGKHQLSLLLIIKGAFTLALLLWFAHIANAMAERTLWRTPGLTPAQKVLFAKLTKIALIALAIILGLNAVGIDFTALAVFSGALGIGIGFGLQKVFANLISGFILLMDKSIKPGDVIAIDDTYGWVNQIGARYVSILTRDGKEHLIPNENLITEPVENWSYSNDKIRVHIPIGVAYSSDRKLVQQIMLSVAAENPRILKDPEPKCLIKGFGDNAVDFELRVWIEDPSNGIANIRSAVYEAMWDAFKEHGVEIPFPQRDINIKVQQLQEAVATLNKPSRQG